MNNAEFESQQAKEIVKHLKFLLCAIFWQRGIYPKSYFSTVEEYGCQLMVPLNLEVTLYVDTLMKQFYKWIICDKFGGLHLTITTKLGDPLEKYCFELSNNTTCPSEIESNITIRQLYQFMSSTPFWLVNLGTDLSFRIQVVEVILGPNSTNDELPYAWGEANPTRFTDAIVRNIPLTQIKNKLITGQIHIPRHMAIQPHYEATTIESPLQS